jgi:hypothetical protein
MNRPDPNPVRSILLAVLIGVCFATLLFVGASS